jgi:hypothetical protein
LQTSCDDAGVRPSITSRLAAWWRRSNVVVAGSLVGAGVALYSTRAAWGRRPPAGEDVMAHLVRLDFGIAELVAHGRLDGWFPRFYLGYQEFLFNGPGLAWAAAVMRAVTLGSLSNAGALKAVGIASVVALPAAVAFAARGLGLGRRAAGIAAVLALLASNVFGLGLQGLYVVGLVPHQLGAVWFFLALGALLRIPADERARWVLLAGVSLAALAVTHLISLMTLAVVVLLCVPGAVRRAPGWAAARRLALAGCVAAGLAAWWLVPLIARRDLRGLVATWATPPFGTRTDEVLDGRILFRPYTAVVVLTAWAYALYRVRHRQPFALTLVLVPPAYLVLAHWTASRWPGNEAAVQLANRGLGYAGVLAVLPLAAALAAGTRWLASRPALALRPAIVDVATLVLAGVLVLSRLGPDRAVVGELPEPVPAMRQAASELARRVPDGRRFATAREYPDEIGRAGVIHPDTWLARVSGRNSLNGFNLESSSTPEAALEPDEIRAQPPEQSADALARLGVTHVVTTGDGLAATLAGSSRFRQVWSATPVTILAVLPRPGRPRPASLLATTGPASARVASASAERVQIEVTAPAATSATVAIAWSPRWHGSVDGEAVDLGRTGDGLIEIRLPAGRSTLELTYGPDVWDRVGTAGTILTLVALAGWGLRARRGRSRSQSTSRSFSRIT